MISKEDSNFNQKEEVRESMANKKTVGFKEFLKDRLKGHVEIFVEDRDGKRTVVHKSNKVVQYGHHIVAHLLADAEDANKVMYIQLGDGGGYPAEPIGTETGCANPIGGFYERDYVAFGSGPPEESVIFTFILDYGEGNGSTYNEAAMFNNDPVPGNRLAFSVAWFAGIPKDISRKLGFIWTINFV